jgi:sialic acid synthase SpsE
MEIQMGRRRINENSAPYVIAEIGANHNGDMELARTMIQSCEKLWL